MKNTPKKSWPEKPQRKNETLPNARKPIWKKPVFQVQVLRPKTPMVPMKVPKDLGLKIGSKKEVMWTNVRNNIKAEIERVENELIVNKELLKIAENHIEMEQEKRKV